MTKEQQTFDWDTFKKFVDEFNSETDRAAVILGAAKLDALLGQILDRHFLPSLSSQDELLEGDGPLASFSAKISIAYRLGIITSDFAKALHQVRKIRNAFAHEISGCRLDTGSQGDRLKSLLIPLRHLPFFNQFRFHFFGDPTSPGKEFRACLSLMVARLENRLIATEQTSSVNAWQFTVDSWADEDTTKEDEGKEKG